MADKRGVASHLDWIIGITLFMFYVLFIIVTLKPGVQPLHKGDTLLLMVQDNFISNVTWDITKVPIFVKPHCVNEETPYASFNFPEEFSDWDNSNTKLYNKLNNQGVDFSIQGNLIAYFGISGADKKEYFLLHSNDPDFIIRTDRHSLSSCSEGVEFIYGIPETLKGLSIKKISYLQTEYNYNKLKTDWNYPETNDFNITININNEKHEISGKRAPPGNANVYVKQFTEFILGDKGEQIPATVIISAW